MAETKRKMSTWLVVGASRGIGLEFVKQLLQRGDRVFATARDINGPKLKGWENGAHERCHILECDVASESSIQNCVSSLIKHDKIQNLDYVVINAGVLRYPNRATEMSFDDFAYHIHTNTIGPVIMAQNLLKTDVAIGTMVFMSSDSGSTTRFLEQEDGFAAYGASKAALNQALRHMAAELRRKGSSTTVLALHPGEVSTDMANIELDWEVEGQMTPEESVSSMIPVIESKVSSDSGTFWTWENKQYPW